MSTTSNDTRFLELLHKWQTGDFTRADEQEMRVLAADDPFRQEAMEGMLEHPELDHVAALRGLRARIRGNLLGKRVGFPQILAIAATLVLLFSAIWFFNIRPVPSEQGQLATDLPTMDEVQPEKSAAPVEVEQPPVPTEMRSTATSKPSAPAGSSAAEADKIIAKEAAPAIAEAKDDSRDNETFGDVAMEERSRAVPQPPGTILDQSTNIARPAERAKQEAGYASKKKATKPADDVGLQQNQISQPKKAGKAKTDDALTKANQPKEGWDNFRVNLDNNARLTPAALANNITGTVRLQFTLDKKSQPVDFKVITSLGYGCDEAAIQLIKDADWTRVNNQVITVDVPFVR